VYFVQFRFGTGYAYRDKKVVGVFVRFRAPLHQNKFKAAIIITNTLILLIIRLPW
jgi:hypothetical protein